MSNRLSWDCKILYPQRESNKTSKGSKSLVSVSLQASKQQLLIFGEFREAQVPPSMKKLHLDFSELLKVLNSSTFFPPADHLTALNYFNKLEPDLVCEELRNWLWLPLGSGGEICIMYNVT